MLLFQVLFACSPSETDSIPTFQDSGQETSVDGRCADGWGAIDGVLEIDEALHVSPEGTLDATGTYDNPFASIDDALEFARSSGTSPDIAVWPGEYPTDLTLLVDSGAGVDDSGTRIVGCGAEEVILVGPEDRPVMDVVGVEDVLVVGLTLRGGYRGLTVRGGSSFESNGVVIEEAVRTGVFIAGAETTATLSDTVVRGVQLDQEAYGWGVVVQDATVVLNQVDVTDTHAVGVLVEFGNATFNGGTVRGVAADEQGLFGRGVQLQNLAQGALADLSVETTADAGVFAHRTVALDVSNIWVVDTGGGLTAEGTPTGDGLVVTQANGNNDPADFQVTVTDSIFECSDRAGVVLDGVTATLNGVTTPDSGLEEGGIGVWAQNGAQVTGENNLAGEPLGLNLVTLSD